MPLSLDTAHLTETITEETQSPLSAPLHIFCFCSVLLTLLSIFLFELPCSFFSLIRSTAFLTHKPSSTWPVWSELSWIPESDRICWRLASSESCYHLLLPVSRNLLQSAATSVSQWSTISPVTNCELNQHLTNANGAFPSQPRQALWKKKPNQPAASWERKKKTGTQIESFHGNWLLPLTPPSATSLWPELPGETFLFPVILVDATV